MNRQAWVATCAMATGVWLAGCANTPAPQAATPAADMPSQMPPTAAGPMRVAPTPLLATSSGFKTSDVNRAAEPIVKAPAPHGRDTVMAERLAKREQCNADPKAELSAKGPGFENFKVPCSRGDALAIRCEFGNCRVLR
jgi:hypothetical protein